MTRYERTNWRDQRISHRHRTWGLMLPATDVDFLMVEYDHGVVAALVDYKEAHARNVDLTSSNFRAQADLYNANGVQIPFFVVWYQIEEVEDGPERWTFSVVAMNVSASVLLDKPMHLPVVMSEPRWVRFLGFLRARARPTDRVA